MIATSDQVQAEIHPKQTKLLGATVKGVGTVAVVSSTLFSCYALIEDEAGNEHHLFLSHLRREEVTFPAAQQPYVKHDRRIGIGTWDQVYSLVKTEAAAAEVAA